MTSALTVGDLRRAIEGLPDDLPVWVEAEAITEGDIDVLHACGTAARFARAGKKDGSLADCFTGPPVDHLCIFADGVPEDMCRDCERDDGTHGPYCEQAESCSDVE